MMGPLIPLVFLRRGGRSSGDKPPGGPDPFLFLFIMLIIVLIVSLGLLAVSFFVPQV